LTVQRLRAIYLRIESTILSILFTPKSSILSKAVAKIRNNSLLAQKHFIKLPYFTTVMTPRIRDKLHVVPSLLHVQGTIKHRHLFDRYSIVFHSFSVSEWEK
jgi:hypothetical protein